MLSLFTLFPNQRVDQNLCTRNADYSKNNNEKNAKPSFLKLNGVKFIQTISQSKSSSKSIHP